MGMTPTVTITMMMMMTTLMTITMMMTMTTLMMTMHLTMTMMMHLNLTMMITKVNTTTMSSMMTTMTLSKNRDEYNKNQLDLYSGIIKDSVRNQGFVVFSAKSRRALHDVYSTIA